MVVSMMCFFLVLYFYLVKHGANCPQPPLYLAMSPEQTKQDVTPFFSLPPLLYSIPLSYPLMGGGGGEQASSPFYIYSTPSQLPYTLRPITSPPLHRNLLLPALTFFHSM